MRDEFVRFVGEIVDRLDINKNGTLEPGKLRPEVGGSRLRPCLIPRVLWRLIDFSPAPTSRARMTPAAGPTHR